MAFHVEIHRSFRRARAFNLSEEKLRRTVVEPWRNARRVELGDREWDPRDSTLRILEGPELSPPDLALDRGWHNAERASQDVTARFLSRAAAAEAAVVAVLAETPTAQRSVTDLLEQLGVRTADWAAVRARILAAATVVAEPPQGLEVVAAILVVEHPEPARGWLFDAGLAIAALGGRAIVAQIGDEPPPPELRDLGAIRLDPGQPASLHALAERLRHAGCPIGSGPG